MTKSQAEMNQKLMNALYYDDFETIDNLLSQGVDVNLPYNQNGWTPFLWVCKDHCSPGIIRQFLDYGGKADWKNNKGSTPLHVMAARRSSFDCLAVLIDAGADPNARDNDGNTPLMIALHHPQVSMRTDVMENLMLVTDLTIQNNKKETAYDIAKANPAFDNTALLLELKPVEKLTDEDIYTLFKNVSDDNNDE